MSPKHTPCRDDDYQEPLPSPRNILAHSLAESLRNQGLVIGPVEREDRKRCWRFRVGKVAGVEVFSPDYLRVTWAFGERQRTDQRIFETDLEAEAFLVALLVMTDYDLAMSIPERQPRRQPKEIASVSGIEPDHFGKGNDHHGDPELLLRQ
jgi:hypothetical protein